MLEISSAALQRIVADAAVDPTRERCGILFGGDNRIADASVCANVAADPARTFEIDPVALFAALRAERASGATIVGYWHSHPSGDVRPSATDAAMAAPDGKIWLIVSGATIGMWRAGNRAGAVRFDAIPYRVGEIT
ncbi:M67 family metallopeptidase [Sphingomonas sp. GC_Shp_3]|uniref:M67 family metallopeptidase n=1 Tax=Sphingomonas sp. GC_Shp_3 TaxID=2937383 RepID=UPI00226AE49D|nr:M67 family metallopeptidase [Sphingomonas sp. GC_Shp_3]